MAVHGLLLPMPMAVSQLLGMSVIVPGQVWWLPPTVTSAVMLMYISPTAESTSSRREMKTTRLIQLIGLTVLRSKTLPIILKEWEHLKELFYLIFRQHPEIVTY
jgi:Trk-type K+ transport system membrane component